MRERVHGIALALCLLLSPLTAPAAWAQAPGTSETDPQDPQDMLAMRAAQLIDLFAGAVGPQDYFTPEFLAAVPPAQFQAVIASVTAQQGQPLAVKKISRSDDQNAVVELTFAASVGTLRLVIDPAQDGRVSGLLITGFSAIDDSLTKVVAEIAALPGTTALYAVPLGSADASPMAAHNPDVALATGSTFKLYVLAELDAQIQARRRRWQDVTQLDRHVFSSAATAKWPMGAPVTLHSLAAWMISVSDNGATDILIDRLGRDTIGRRMQRIGNSALNRSLPMLTTVEAFALKASANDDLRGAFLAGDAAARRLVLQQSRERLTNDAAVGDGGMGRPRHIDSIEWFASGADIARLMAYLRSSASPEARAIMAMNPGLPAGSAARWAYAGYKGGSESGVISMSYLLQAKNGRWFALSGSWNNIDAPVDNARFAALMHRAADALALAVAD